MNTSPNDTKLNHFDKQPNAEPLNTRLASQTLNTDHAALSHPKSQTNLTDSPSLVPKRVTIGLALFSLILSLSGYGFRLAVGEELTAVLKHAAMLVPAFVIGVPLLFWLGSLIMNKVTGSNIQRRNALTLGWLFSSVAMLWLMGTYS